MELIMVDFIPATLAAADTAGEAVRLWMAIPFALLLVLIAVMPLTPHRTKELWEKYYPHVSIILGVLVATLYGFFMPGGGHAVWHSFKEYISFIALVGSLFVISGGIVIHLRGEATPKTNFIFLLVGSILANLIGTTGASMVLIRPWMRMNKYRLSSFHIVFFIFLVSNVGGALTPIGDPPLYIGYLRGVPFFWILENAILPWTFVTALLLGIFYLFDLRSFRKSGRRGQVAEKSSKEMLLSVRGMKNVGFLLIIVCAVFLPGQVSPETRGILETYFVREIVMLAAAVASYFMTKPDVHAENEFNFAPIKEVGFLFIGIFLTMVPALAYLTANGKLIGEALSQSAHYFFASGMLSGFLDNTPTYANFFDLIKSQIDAPTDAAKVAVMINPANLREHAMLLAVSLGSVFFGALTYIGNGPNFMVKSIADSAGVKTPSFFGYFFRYGILILLPVLILCAVIFFPNVNADSADAVPATQVHQP